MQMYICPEGATKFLQSHHPHLNAFIMNQTKQLVKQDVPASEADH